MYRRPKSNSPFIMQMEEVAEIVARDIADSVKAILDELMPDGVPWGGEKKSEREQLMDYQKMRGNPMEWQNWIQNKVDEINSTFAELFSTFKVPPSAVETLHPYDVALRMAVAYSSKMERLLKEYDRKALAESELRPLLLLESE